MLQTGGSISFSDLKAELYLPDTVVNTYNWYNNMTYSGTGYTPVVSGTDPTMQIQMTPGSGTVTSNLSSDERVQDFYSFTMTFDINMNAMTTSDNFTVYFGSGGSSTAYQFIFKSPAGTPGIYLVDGTGATVASASNAFLTSAFISVVITYNNNLTNTWSISMGGSTVLSYADNLLPGWISTSGKTWGFSTTTSASTLLAYIRKINLSTSQGNSQKLVTPLNWYTSVASGTTSGCAAISSSDPLVQMQLASTATGNGYLNFSNRLQDYESFELSFSINNPVGFVGASPADALSVYFGSTSTNGSFRTGTNNGMNFSFDVYTIGASPQPGINLYNYNGTQVVRNTTITYRQTATWYPVKITYNRSTTNTWTMTYNGSVLYTYSDPNVETWISSTSGSNWGFNGFVGAYSTNFYIRNVQLSYVPKAISFSNIKGTNGIRTISTGLDQALLQTAGSLSFSNLYNIQNSSLNSFTNLANDLSGANVATLGADTSTKSVWNESGALTSAKNEIYINFQQTYTNTTNNKLDATLYVQVDDFMKVYHNKNLLRDGVVDKYQVSTLTIPVVLTPGVNIFDFIAVNIFGPAVILWSLQNTSGTLMRSDNYNSTALSNTTKVVVAQTSGNLMYLNKIPILDAISPSLKSLCTGAYDLKRLSLNYTGPAVSLSKVSTDTVGTLFYADLAGNLGTSLNAGGTIASAWIGTVGSIYVNTWYDQSGTGNHATQTTGSLRPVLTCLSPINYDAATQYPPAALTANSTTLSGTNTYLGDGTYVASASNFANASYVPFNAFDNNVNNLWGIGNYNINTGVYAGAVSTTVSSAAVSGEWLQIQMPNAIYPVSFTITPYTGGSAYYPKSFVIAGSNNGTTWFSLYSNTNVTWSSGVAQTFISTFNKTSYLYYRVIIRATPASAGTSDWIMINQLSINGSIISPDTYVIDTQNSSSQYLQLPSGTVPVGVTNAPYSILFKHGTVNNTTTGGIIGTGTSISNLANNIRFFNNTSYVNYWFNNDIFGGTLATNNKVCVDYDGAYKTLYVNGTGTTTTNSAANTAYTNSAGPQYIGRTILTNEYLNGQLYNLYIFKSSLNTPYPPFGLTSNSTTISSRPYGNGTYIASASSTFTAVSAYSLFDKIVDGSPAGFRSGVAYTTGVYSGAVSTTLSGSSYSGEWVKIQLPNAINLKCYDIQAFMAAPTRSPITFYIGGSNDGTTWDLIDAQNNISWVATVGSKEVKTFRCDNNVNSYSYYIIIVNKIGSTTTSWGACEWVLYEDGSDSNRLILQA